MSEIPKHLPADALALMQSSGLISRLGAAFTPGSTANLPPAVLEGIRLGLADALRPVFAAGLPLMAIAFLATLFMKELPLRESVRSSPDGPSDNGIGDGAEAMPSGRVGMASQGDEVEAGASGQDGQPHVPQTRPERT